MHSDHTFQAVPPHNHEIERLADKTRQSLIQRLQDWQDQRSWDDFYRTYWRLIYSAALKTGLQEQEAWDVVQETILTVAKQSKKDIYNPERGSFKSWLWNITRWRINDRLRARLKEPIAMSGNQDGEEDHNPIENQEDISGKSFDKIWDEEWQTNLMKAALERVKIKVSAQQFQIFDHHVLRDLSASEVKKKLGVSTAQVYLSKHRVGQVLKKEIQYLREQENSFADSLSN